MREHPCESVSSLARRCTGVAAFAADPNTSRGKGILSDYIRLPAVEDQLGPQWLEKMATVYGVQNDCERGERTWENFLLCEGNGLHIQSIMLIKGQVKVTSGGGSGGDDDNSRQQRRSTTAAATAMAVAARTPAQMAGRRCSSSSVADEK
ncbi:hypothetical protein Scep_010013 [Stephania cephalantha]|uniref:Uncharacterized protein n=1 Tax=Stephania cephalantha TaxID=152367 RepID=A0AAP0PDN7_9MAGN